MLSPLAASKRSESALSPIDVALFPTSPCTAEGSVKEASRTPGILSPGGAPAIQPAGFPPALLRSTKRAREAF